MKTTAFIVRVKGQAGLWRDYYHVAAHKPHAEEMAGQQFERLCQQSTHTEVLLVKVSEETMAFRR